MEAAIEGNGCQGIIPQGATSHTDEYGKKPWNKGNPPIHNN
jgi:hypothetical protein